MRLLPAALATAAGALALAAPAGAATFTVTSPADSGPDTLRQALLDADASPGADAIVFGAGVGEVDVASTLESNDTVTLDGPVALRWSGGAGPLLHLAAGAAGSAVEDVDVIGAGSSGIDVAAAGVVIRRGSVSRAGGAGIDVNGNDTVVTETAVYGNGGQPIAASPVGRPSGLRVGPRRADGVLALTGTTGGGTLELFRGNPAAASPIAFLRRFAVPAGAFTHALSPEPAPGSSLAATVRSGATSGFSSVGVPFDLESPDLAGAVAISTNEVTVQLSEPLRPDSVQIEDFSLSMAGVPRSVDALRIEPGGAQVTLASAQPWGHGEAGAVQLGPPGSLLDLAGNASLAATGARVAAAPGDLLAPIGSSLSISPRSLCLTVTRGCRRTGTTVRFVASEAGRAHLVIMRGNRTIGTDVALSKVGRNRVRFNGRLNNRKLRAGGYRMLLYLEDAVGNITAEPPLQLFTVRRAARRR